MSVTEPVAKSGYRHWGRNPEVSGPPSRNYPETPPSADDVGEEKTDWWTVGFVTIVDV